MNAGKKPDAPCRADCPDRCATCHTDCEAYLRFRAELEEFKRITSPAVDGNRASKQFLIDAIAKTNKRRRTK